jgi:hypothetical protein
MVVLNLKCEEELNDTTNRSAVIVIPVQKNKKMADSLVDH